MQRSSVHHKSDNFMNNPTVDSSRMRLVLIRIVLFLFQLQVSTCFRAQAFIASSKLFRGKVSQLSSDRFLRAKHGHIPSTKYRSIYNIHDVTLHQSSYLDGSGSRGSVMFALAIALGVWIFSIPPEIRRQHICTPSACVENRSKCYDCVTLGEWNDGVVEYYKNGGGVQFDFSVDPATLEFWANLRE